MAEIEYSFNAESRVVLFAGAGLITGTELMEAITRCGETFDIAENVVSIIEFSRAKVRMNEAEIAAYRKFFLHLQDRRDNVVWHICALEPETLGFARWVHNLLDNGFNITVNIHETDEAIEALRQRFL
ncbi:MAG: hypothetical protein ACYTGH_19190 [Planctomycetota bacterium]